MLNTFTFGISHLQPSAKNKGSIKCNQAKEDLMHAVPKSEQHSTAAGAPRVRLNEFLT